MLRCFPAIGDGKLLIFRSLPYNNRSDYPFLSDIQPFATAKMMKNVMIDQAHGKVVMTTLFDLITIPNIFAN